MAAQRVPLVAGNWKMHPASRSEAILLAHAVAEATAGLPVRTVVCPPTVFLEAVATGLGGGTTEPGGTGIGAQTMHAAESGAEHRRVDRDDRAQPGLVVGRERDLLRAVRRNQIEKIETHLRRR